MDKPMRVLAVVASQAGGNTDRLVGHVLKAAADAQPGLSPTTVHLGAGPLDPARVESSMQSLAAADAVLLGTPMFRSTYAAVLKEFLERVPRGGPNERFDGPLRAKAVGIVATGGSHHHFLGADPEATLVEDAARFGRALVGLGAAIRSDARLGDARAQI